MSTDSITLISPNNGMEQVVDYCAGLLGTEVADKIGEVVDDMEEDVKAPKVAARPYQPTKAEIEAHEITHLPYRNWCEHCVAGKGVSSPHISGPAGDRIGITISMDYCFMGEEATEGTPPVLIAWDDGHRALWALPVDHKGAEEYVVNWLVRKIDEAGYSGVPLTIKTDQEPAIIALKRAVAIRRQAETTPIESPVRESKSNGAVERAVRTWQAQFRTLRHQIEANLETKMEMSHPLIEWMTIWATDLILRYVMRENGRTAYESITGHRCRSPVVMFSETIMFRLAPDKSSRNKADSDWHVGIFVGIESRTSEYLVQNKDGVFKCRTIRRLSRDKAFSKDTLTMGAWGISDYVNKGARTSAEARQGEQVREGVPGGREFAPRRARLLPDDFKRHGFTQGCRGCAWVEDGVGARVAHTEECRTRLEKLLEEDETGKQRLDRAKDRIDHWTAGAGEAQIELEEIAVDGTSQQDQQEQHLESGMVTPPPRGEMSDGNEESPIDEIFGDFDSDLGEAMDHSIPTPISDRQPVPQTPEDRAKASGSQEDPRSRSPRRFGGGINKEDSWNWQPPADASRSDVNVSAADTSGMGAAANMSGPSATVTYNSDQPSDTSMDSMSAVDRKILSFAIMGVDITEIYSPARVTQVCSRFGLEPGSAMDLHTGYDFDTQADRNRAVRKVLTEKPKLLIGSPPCTYVSVLQELNKWINRDNQEWLDRFELNRQKAIRHVEFCCKLYKMQMAGGRYFLHEHPWTARSWELDAMESLLADPRVKKVKTHMCQFGMTSRRGAKGSEEGPVKKPTGFASNSHEILQELAKECRNVDHDHVPLMGGRAAAAAIYPVK